MRSQREKEQSRRTQGKFPRTQQRIGRLAHRRANHGPRSVHRFNLILNQVCYMVDSILVCQGTTTKFHDNVHHLVFVGTGSSDAHAIPIAFYFFKGDFTGVFGRKNLDGRRHGNGTKQRWSPHMWYKGLGRKGEHNSNKDERTLHLKVCNSNYCEIELVREKKGLASPARNNRTLRWRQLRIICQLPH
jgi:hypothetical protein